MCGEGRSSSHFLPLCISERAIFGKMRVRFSPCHFLAVFLSIFLGKYKNTARLCGVFAVHLFSQHVLMYEGADHVYFDLTRPLAPQVAAEKAYYDRMGLDTEGDPAGPEADFDKFVVWTGPGFDLDAFRREVEPGFDLILREGCLIELVSRGCSKGKAMEALMARHGMDRADCVAIGDSTNDLPMLETAGVSVAMGNGDPRIFDRVSFVTAPVEQDGIAKALERLGLI